MKIALSASLLNQ